jgi:glycosyltransferase involved in cell wall biosynthesis
MPADQVGPSIAIENQPQGTAREGSFKDQQAGTKLPTIRVAINALTELTPKFGSRVYLMNLTRELSKLPDVDPILLVGKRQVESLPSDLKRLAREIDIPHTRSYWQVLFQERICKFLRMESVDIYHLTNTLPLLRKMVPTVVTIHDLADLRVRKYGWLRTTYRFGANFSAARLADRILTVSENSKSDIVRLLRVSEAKVVVTYPGVDASFRQLDHDQSKRYLGATYPITNDFILAPGGVSRNKNVYGILRAFATLKESGVAQQLVFTGSGESDDYRAVCDEIHRLHLEKEVILTGHVPAVDLPAFYNACSLVVYPSLYEGFGLPAVEAMACGAPLVTSNVSSLPEVVADAGLLIDPRQTTSLVEAISLLLREHNLRNSLIERGVRRAQDFSWQATAEQTAQVYRDVLREESSCRGL